MTHIITEHNADDFKNTVIDGEKMATGLIPRDYSKNPKGCYAFAEPFPDSMLIPEDELEQRIKDQEAKKASLLDIRNQHYSTLKSLNQDSLGLCWAFSTTKSMMYLRVIMGLPPLVLSAWYVAGRVKGWRDQGGWGGESLAFIVSDGVPTMDMCPSYKSSYDSAATRANAAMHKCTEWWEGSDDPDKAWHQKCSAHVLGFPTVDDYNFLSHSMCGIKANSYKNPECVEDNSWGENSGEKGLYIIKGRNCRPDGLWIPRVQAASLT